MLMVLKVHRRFQIIYQEMKSTDVMGEFYTPEKVSTKTTYLEYSSSNNLDVSKRLNERMKDY